MSAADEFLTSAASRVDELAVGDMSSKPSRKVAVLCCMDTRIDVPRMLGLERGEAHVLRNAGGLVTDDVLRSLSGSQRLLGTEEVVVIMHERCGLLGAPEEYGGFDDLEGALRDGLARLRAAPELPAHDHIRGFVFDPVHGTLRDVEA